MSELPSLDDVSRSLRRLALGIDASELHGALCGWLAGNGDADGNWLAQVLADPAVSAPEPGSALDELRKVTATQFEDRGFGFELLLPDAAAPLAERAGALFEWCRGFLGGFGLAAGAQPRLSAESEEALQDLARLAQAVPEDSDDEQEDEDALAEIEEFVRVAALLLHGDVVMAARHRQKLN
ncbi:MAG: UPF0149 family protein [Pseudoxanthomonas sp.]